ncbi:ATP-binding cassette domain-containing protein [Myxococcota bacterium]|jgi:phospholipid/cholesterol/gamma-HCH transport system ATP-binding protein|nr:ATP-binding cassette domain-containing protein [Myxococcota bacterium]
MLQYAAQILDASLTLNDSLVLDQVFLQLESGRIHALVGAGGSGKTLLLRMLATLLQPSKGELHLFKKAVNFRDLKSLRQVRSNIGVQFQNLALFDFLTVGQNVGFPLEQDSELTKDISIQVKTALDSVGLDGRQEHAISALSGGMQRRVAIARAAVAKPKLLLFDDPSGGLDPVTTSRIFELIRTIQKENDNTVVIASHDIDRLVKLCHIFHVVDHGKVIFSGTLSEARQSTDDRVKVFLDV